MFSRLFIPLAFTALAALAQAADQAPGSYEADMGTKVGKLFLTPVLADKSGERMIGYEVREASGRFLQFIKHEFNRENRVAEWTFLDTIGTVDADFDGFPDLQLQDDGFTGHASPNQTYSFYLWDPVFRRFFANVELGEAGIQEVESNGNLHVYGRCGSSWSRLIYRWDKKKHIELIEKEEGHCNESGAHYSKTIYGDKGKK